MAAVASRKMPNILTLGGIVLGVGLNAAIGYADDGTAGALRGLGRAGAGVLLCGIMPVMSFAKGTMGGGDVKLFAAIGALLGPLVGFDVQAAAFIVMFLVLPWRLAREGAFRASLANTRIELTNLFRRRANRVPLAPLKLKPMILGPTIFVALCLALARHWPLT
jgi:prepilin peptidase CpaA